MYSLGRSYVVLPPHQVFKSYSYHLHSLTLQVEAALEYLVIIHTFVHVCRFRLEFVNACIYAEWVLELPGFPIFELLNLCAWL